MNDYTISFKRSEPKPMWSYPLSLVEYEAEIEMLKSRIAELEERLRWKPLSELPKEKKELLAQTNKEIVLLIDSHDIEEFNSDDIYLDSFGEIVFFMELPEVKNE